MRVEFEVPGVPRGKQRPRTVRTRNGIRTYTPKETAEYEKLVRMCYRRQAGEKMVTGPVEMTVTAYFPIPKAVSKKKRKQMEEERDWHIKRPDIDNVVKAVMDGCTGVAYRDDAAVSALYAEKLYSAIPRVKVVLEELESEEKNEHMQIMRSGNNLDKDGIRESNAG